MSSTRIFFGVVAYIGMFMPLIGVIIGCFRYRKNSERVRKEVHEDYLRSRERGGLSLLYYKNEGKRVFKRTFGTPISITFFIGLILLLIGFAGMR